MSPPLEYIPADSTPAPSHLRWILPGRQAQEAAAFLDDVGVGPRERDAILAGARPDSALNGVVATPALATVASLPASVRQQLYLALDLALLFGVLFQHWTVVGLRGS